MIFVTRENKVLNIYTQRSSSPLLTLFKLFQPMLQEASLKSSANNHRLVLVLGIKKKKNRTKRLPEFIFNTQSPCFLHRRELRWFPGSRPLGYPRFLSLPFLQSRLRTLGDAELHFQVHGRRDDGLGENQHVLQADHHNQVRKYLSGGNRSGAENEILGEKQGRNAS